MFISNFGKNTYPWVEGNPNVFGPSFLDQERYKRNAQAPDIAHFVDLVDRFCGPNDPSIPKPLIYGSRMLSPALAAINNNFNLVDTIGTEIPNDYFSNMAAGVINETRKIKPSFYIAGRRAFSLIKKSLIVFEGSDGYQAKVLKTITPALRSDPRETQFAVKNAKVDELSRGIKLLQQNIDFEMRESDRSQEEQNIDDEFGLIMRSLNHSKNIKGRNF